MKKKILFIVFSISALFFLSHCEKSDISERERVPPDIHSVSHVTTDENGFIDLASLPEMRFAIDLPEVIMSSIPNEQNEIGEKSSLRFSFSREMNKKSVEEAMILNPKVQGSFHWEDEKTVEFLPEKPFEAGKKYSLTLSSDALSADGKNLPEEYFRKFSVTNELKILAVLPENLEVSPDTDISIIFNQPISELSAIDELKNQDFGLQIEPKFPFRYRLAGTNTLQIQGQMPADEHQDEIERTEGKKTERRLPRSSKITVTIPKGFSALNGSALAEAKTFSFTTTPIRLLTNNFSNIHPFSPLVIQFRTYP